MSVYNRSTLTGTTAFKKASFIHRQSPIFINQGHLRRGAEQQLSAWFVRKKEKSCPVINSKFLLFLSRPHLVIIRWRRNWRQTAQQLFLRPSLQHQAWRHDAHFHRCSPHYSHCLSAEERLLITVCFWLITLKYGKCYVNKKVTDVYVISEMTIKDKKRFFSKRQTYSKVSGGKTHNVDIKAGFHLLNPNKIPETKT